MPDYLLLLHEDTARFSKMSPSDMQATIERYQVWAGKLRAAGKLNMGRKLRDEGGLHVRRDRGQMVASDGPYAEAKDAISGLFVIRAESYEEARTLVRDCPHLEFGWIEVREIEITD
jgi:hypothetical protein